MSLSKSLHEDVYSEFQTIGDTKYFKYKDCEKGDLLVQGEFVKEFEGMYGAQFEYMSDDGSPVVLNAAAKLTAKMKFAKPGDRVRITYDGETTVHTGPMKGKPMHLFEVSIAKRKTPAVEETSLSEAVDSVEDADFVL